MTGVDLSRRPKMQALNVEPALERRAGRERRMLTQWPQPRRRHTRLMESSTESWGRLLRETWRCYVNEILVGLLVAVILAMLLTDSMLEAEWRSESCIAALKEPGVNPAVLMAVCR
jgi:hypothetical protein